MTRASSFCFHSINLNLVIADKELEAAAAYPNPFWDISVKCS